MTVETITFDTASYPQLTYSRTPVPVAVLDGKPWWSTAHIQHFLGDRFRPQDCELFTSAHVGAHRFPFDTEDEQSHVISSLAALEIAGRNPDRRANKMLAGWLRKRNADLRTAAPDKVGTLFSVTREGPAPTQPWHEGDLSAEWDHWEVQCQQAFGFTPRPTNRYSVVGSLPNRARKPIGMTKTL